VRWWNGLAPVWKYIATLLPVAAGMAPELVKINPEWSPSIKIVQALVAFLLSVGLLHTTPPKPVVNEV
jgi:hypothetical protein